MLKASKIASNMRTTNLNRLWKISVFLFGENPELCVLGIGLFYETIVAASTLKIDTRELFKIPYLSFILYVTVENYTANIIYVKNRGLHTYHLHSVKNLRGFKSV